MVSDSGSDVGSAVKLVRCRCGHEHQCPARLSNRERAAKAARARVRTEDRPYIEKLQIIHGINPDATPVQRAGCVRHPHKREAGCKWCEV